MIRIKPQDAVIARCINFVPGLSPTDSALHLPRENRRLSGNSTALAVMIQHAAVAKGEVTINALILFRCRSTNNGVIGSCTMERVTAIHTARSRDDSL